MRLRISLSLPFDGRHIAVLGHGHLNQCPSQCSPSYSPLFLTPLQMTQRCTINKLTQYRLFILKGRIKKERVSDRTKCVIGMTTNLSSTCYVRVKTAKVRMSVLYHIKFSLLLNPGSLLPYVNAKRSFDFSGFSQEELHKTRVELHKIRRYT